MSANRSYPPELCSAETMAFLLDMSPSTFRDLVKAGILPDGVKRQGTVRWHRVETVAAYYGARSGAHHVPEQSERSFAEEWGE